MTPEALEQHVRARFLAWAAGDLVELSELGLDSGAVGFGFRTRAARSAIPKSAGIEALRSFLASLEYDRPTLDELHTAVDGDVGLAWGFYTEDFKVRGREPEKVRARFTLTFKHDTSGWRPLLYHRDIQPFDERGRYIPIAPPGSSSIAQEPRPTSDEAEHEVRQVERDLTEALGRGDLTTAERIYADEYSLTSADGEVQNKAQRITALQSTDPKNVSRNRDDIIVRAYGVTAIVTGCTLFRVRSKGEESSESRRFIHVWEKRQGRWQMIASQVTRVAEAPSLPKANGGSFASAAKSEPATGARQTSVEEEIKRLEDERAEAAERGDIELLKRMSSDDYIATSATGQVKTRAQVLEGIKSGQNRWNSIHDDIRVRVYGDTAVITGRSTRKGRENNNEVDDQVRFTGVYAKQNGRWRKVAHQATRIAGSQAVDEQSEPEARRVIDAFNRANNRRDVEGLRNAVNFPFVRIASGKLSITRTREEFTIEDWPPGAAAEGWHHSTVDSVQFVQSSTEKVHAIVIFSRYKADGTRYVTHRTLRIITKQDGHWGIQCSSSFAP